MKKEKIILGIDPGTNIMGYGLIKKRKNEIIFLCLDVILLNKISNHNLKLKKIFEKTSELIKLYEIEYISEKQLINKGLSSKSKLNLASFNLENAKSDLIDINLKFQIELSNLQSQLASFKSQLKQINLDIDNTNISAPFDGIITNKNIELSDYVVPGKILLTIVNLNPIKILKKNSILKLLKNSNQIMKK